MKPFALCDLFWLFGWILLLSFFFAKLEIQIEGEDGWAANLPTWRIERHWLLDLFWGGRPMTGYHAWAFSFMALAFHLPVFLQGQWTLRLEARILGSLMFFWVWEDLWWFALNPAFGLRKFRPEHIPWHKRWRCCVPVDYLKFTLFGGLLLWYSY